MTSNVPYVVVTGRRCGKTTKCLEWLAGAKRVPHYPFWDRILLTFSPEEAQRIRVKLRTDAEEANLPDAALYYNLVYSFEEWRTAHLGSQWSGEVAVDNAEFIISQYFRQRQRLAIITITGTLVEDHD